jgi:hypothetical protein
MAFNTRNAATASATSTIKSVSGDVLPRTRNRKGGFIQNLQNEKLYVYWGTGASATVFSAILAPGAAVDDGLGGSLPFNGYTGVVSVFGAVNVRCIVTEET